MSINEKSVTQFATENTAILARQWPELNLEKYAHRFVAAEKDVGPLVHYKIFGSQAHQIFSEVQSRHGIHASRALARIVLLTSTATIAGNGAVGLLPPLIRSCQLHHLQRIAKDTSVESEWLHPESDLFQKEFGLASLRLFAAGAQLIDVRCGVPRSVIFKGSLKETVGNAFFFLRAGGFKPYFQIHTHTFNLDRFNEAGWEECYRGCAELYGLFPDALGMFGGSWFYDPALDHVSPRLGYLRNTPLEGGGRIMYYGSDEASKANALSSSPTRRTLYEQGKYSPRSFMLVWPRAQQIAWARTTVSA